MANEWNKSAFVEFETMLRRHLRSGAAPVTACAGFDLDAASAYLEGALDEWRRESYESHLAGCAICRRHLIELARLAQAAPSFESRPAAAPDRIPAWDRWKEALAGWFDLSTWNLKWQVAGAAGVAFAILITALGAQWWLHTSNRAVAELSGSGAPSARVTESEVQALPLPTPGPSLQDAAIPVVQDLMAGSSAGSAIPAPAAPVRPIENPANVPVVASSKLLALNPNQSSEAPPAAKPVGADTKPSPPPQPRSFTQMNNFSRAGGSVLEVRDAPKEQAAEEIAQGPDITPPPYRAPLVPDKPEPPSKAPPNKPISRQALDAVREMIKRVSPTGKLGFTSDSERKEISDTRESPEDESSKLLVWRVRGKVFRFEKDTWVDQEYKPEMQEWRRWTLKRGSEEYKRALAAEPLLKEFFDRAPILVVWKDEIYKVLK